MKQFKAEWQHRADATEETIFNVADIFSKHNALCDYLGEKEKSHVEITTGKTYIYPQDCVQKETPAFRAPDGEAYWYISDKGSLTVENDFEEKDDEYRYKTGNYYENKEQAEQARNLLLNL